MKYYIILFTLIFSSYFSQIKFNVEYEADYELNYKDRNTPDAIVNKTTFALLLNKNESFFKNMNKYVLDSLAYEKKIVYSGDAYQDMKATEKYYTDFPEAIGMTTAKIYVSLPIYNKNFRYEESNKLDWILSNEFKTIGKYKCQKAVTEKYGRKWTAWFSKDIPFPYGPYKFSGLPGLILEIYDQKRDYIFTMYSFRKRKYTCLSANMYNSAKLVNKKKVFDFKRKSMQDINKFKQIVDDPEIIKIITREAPKFAKAYNPLELQIE